MTLDQTTGRRIGRLLFGNAYARVQKGTFTYLCPLQWTKGLTNVLFRISFDNLTLLLHQRCVTLRSVAQKVDPARAGGTSDDGDPLRAELLDAIGRYEHGQLRDRMQSVKDAKRKS